MENRLLIAIKNISVQPGPDAEIEKAAIDHILSIVKFLQTRLITNEEFVEWSMERDFVVTDWQPDVEVKGELGTDVISVLSSLQTTIQEARGLVPDEIKEVLKEMSKELDVIKMKIEKETTL